MNILVTGGLGYIGSHTIVELQTAGHDVTCIDNCSNSSLLTYDNIVKITGKDFRYYNLDLHLEPSTSNIWPDFSAYDAVIHFAAMKSVGESMIRPGVYYKNNLNSTLQILEHMKRGNTKNLVFSSSCTVYGEPESCPVTEVFPIKPPSSVYGHTKQICEDIINNFHLEHDYNNLNLRYFNPVGAHASGEIGELPNGVPDNLMPYVTQTAVGKRDKLTIFGNTYDTPDGTCIRDYIHVVDLAQAHVKAVELLHEKNSTGFKDHVNLGTGNGYSVNEIVDTFERENDIKVTREYGPPRSGDITEVYADPSYALQLLGWEAKLGLKEMVTSAWKWEKTRSGDLPDIPINGCGDNQ